MQRLVISVDHLLFSFSFTFLLLFDPCSSLKPSFSFFFYLLSFSVDVLFVLLQPISASAAHILGDIFRERYEAVLPMVRLLLYHNRFVPFVSAVAALELDNTQ